jgi:type VI secretion system ImpH/TssG family protein
MASFGWRSAASVKSLVLGAPERFDVFQLVRLLRLQERSPADTQLARSLSWRLMNGHADTRSQSGAVPQVLFRADLSPQFPGVEVTGCRYVDDAEGESESTVEIRTPNYCVASELGPLPEPFLEWVRDRLRDDDPTFAAFLDIFNHRVNVLRHQLKASQDVALDPAAPQDALQADLLACLAGMASPAAEAQIALPRRAWLGMAATLADPRRNIASAQIALRQYLGVPAARLEPLVGDWKPLLPEQWMHLGRPGATLGGDAVLGTKVWDEMAGVRLRVPDVDYERLCALLPPWRAPHDRRHTTGGHGAQRSDEGGRRDVTGGLSTSAASAAAPLDGHRGLAHMVHLLFDRRVDCTVELTTPAVQLPPPVLTALPGADETAPSMPAGVRYRGLRLGQTAWIAGGAAQAGEPRQVVFTIAGDPQGGAFQ